MTAYTNDGKRNSGRKPKLSERDSLRWRGLCLKIIELLRKRWQQNSVFILKTLFPQKQSSGSFGNSTSTVELQLVKLWLLKKKNAKRRKRWCEHHKSWTSDDWKHVIWSVELSCTLFQGECPRKQESWMLRSKCETWRQICDDLGIIILVFCWSNNYSEWSNYCQWLCGRFR